MKKPFTISTLAAFLFMATITIGQVQVNLNIEHMLKTEAFDIASPTTNNLDKDFDVSRLQYYISEVSVVHDGAMETNIPDLWVLVDAAQTTTVDLGMLNVTTIEGIKFYIGVDQAHNHLDPSMYASGHPLAPSSPSMHWGWAAGYRFVAMEGKGGSSFNQTYEIHALGDNNYFGVHVEMDAVDLGGILEINLEADYTEALRDIDVSSGLIIHGEDFEAVDLLNNFSTNVFKAASAPDTTTAIQQPEWSQQINIAPNPGFNNGTVIYFGQQLNETLQVSVLDVNGRLVSKHVRTMNTDKLALTGLDRGFYFIRIAKENGTTEVRKVVLF